MIDAQLKRHLDEFLDQNYGAEAYAAFASRLLNVEFEPKQFVGSNAGEAAEYAVDHARRMSETLALDLVEENLPDDAPEEEWNWQALAKAANARWRCAINEHDLRKLGREHVAEFLIERAETFCNNTDLSSGANLLEQNYGIQTACRWLRDKFGVVVNPAEAEKMEPSEFREHARQKTLEGYAEREARFPVLVGLAHFTIRDQNGRRYDREGVADWAARRFNVQLDVEELRNKQRHEIEETLFQVSRDSSKQSEPYYATMREKLAKLFQEEEVDVESIRKVREEKIRRNDRITSRDVRKIRRDSPALADLCNWLNTALRQQLTVEELSEWDVLLLENRVESIIENEFNSEMRKVERSLILGILDASWKEHLQVMDHLKSSVSFRGYAQVDPKVEYKREGMRIFDAMWDGVFERVTDYVYRVEQLDENFIGSTWSDADRVGAAQHPQQQAVSPEVEQTMKQQDDAIEASKEHKVETYRNKSPKIGRNDPCPCGSGKKYKNCCGKNR